MNKRLKTTIVNFLNEKNLIVKETPDNYYFLGNENDQLSQIRVKKNDMGCYVYYDLSEEIELFFSLTSTDSRGVLTKYVENILNIEVSYTHSDGLPLIFSVGNPLNITVPDTLNINPLQS